MTISIVPLTSSDQQRLLDVDNAAFFFDPNMYPGDVVTSHFDWAGLRRHPRRLGRAGRRLLLI